MKLLLTIVVSIVTVSLLLIAFAIAQDTNSPVPAQVGTVRIVLEDTPDSEGNRVLTTTMDIDLLNSSGRLVKRVSRNDEEVRALIKSQAGGDEVMGGIAALKVGLLAAIKTVVEQERQKIRDAVAAE